MLIHKAYKFRLYPNAEQREGLARQFGCSRFVYNHFLRLRIDHYAATGTGLSYRATAKMLTDLKTAEGFEWLQEGIAQALQQALRDLDAAYRNFFDKRSSFPSFKSKRDKQAFRIPQGFRVEDSKLLIPKMAALKMVAHRPIEGVIKQVTVSKTKGGRYFASILCEVEAPEPERAGGVVGIDLGLKDFIVASDGMRVPAPQFLRQAEKRLGRLQRSLSRRKKGSAGREKARRAVARQHEKVANQRNDFLHKLSRRLVDENQAIGVESLHVKGMVRNHHLAKSISDAGWGEFVRQLQYKGAWYGCDVRQVDRFFPSSKRCHDCGYINQLLVLAQREWACPECGTLHDRDINAAKNILMWSTVGATGINADGEHVRQLRASHVVASSLKSEASRESVG